MKSPSRGDNRIHKSLLIPKQEKSVSATKDKVKEANQNQTINSNLSMDTFPIKSHRSSTHDIHKQNYVNFKQYLQLLIKDLQEKKQRLEATVKMYSLFQGHNGTLRCMEHNNLQTVYCITERRVLCTNCVFGAARHRTHKMKPLKDAFQYIEQDNVLLNKIIEHDMQAMNDSIKSSQFNSMKLESQLKYELEKLEIDYRKKKEYIDEKYALEKQGLKRVFEGLIQKSKTSERLTEQLKFKTWQAASKLGTGKRTDVINMQASIARQVFLVKLSQLTQIKVKTITERQIDKLNKSILKS